MLDMPGRWHVFTQWILIMVVSFEIGLQTALKNALMPAFFSLLQPISNRNDFTA